MGNLCDTSHQHARPQLQSSKVYLSNDEHQQKQSSIHIRCKNLSKIRQKYATTSYIDEETPYMSVVSMGFSHANHIHGTSSVFQQTLPSVYQSGEINQYSSNLSEQSKSVVAEHYYNDLHRISSAKSLSMQQKKPVEILLKTLATSIPEGPRIQFNQWITFKHFKSDLYLRVRSKNLPREGYLENADKYWQLCSKDEMTESTSDDTPAAKCITSQDTVIMRSIELDSDLMIVKRRDEGMEISCEKRKRVTVEKNKNDSGVNALNNKSIKKSDTQNWLWRIIVHNPDGVLRENSIVSIVHSQSNKLIVPARKVETKMMDIGFSQKKYSANDREIFDLWIVLVENSSLQQQQQQHLQQQE